MISKEQIIRETMQRTRQRILAAMEQQIAVLPEGWAKAYLLHQAGVAESHLAAALRKGQITEDDFSYLHQCCTFLKGVPYLIRYYYEHDVKS